MLFLGNSWYILIPVKFEQLLDRRTRRSCRTSRLRQESWTCHPGRRPGRPEQAKKINEEICHQQSNCRTCLKWAHYVGHFCVFFSFVNSSCKLELVAGWACLNAAAVLDSAFGHINGTQKASSWLALRSKVGWLVAFGSAEIASKEFLDV